MLGIYCACRSCSSRIGWPGVYHRAGLKGGTLFEALDLIEKASRSDVGRRYHSGPQMRDAGLFGQPIEV